MALKIVVCIKPVPDPQYYDKVSIDPVTKSITREGIPTIINPVDKNGIEAALQLKQTYGGKVTVITMAPPNATENLREALAMGADEAVLLSDRAFGGADTLATSYTLAKGIEKLGGFDIVFCGAESADGATAQVSSQLGEWLEVPHLWNVFSMEALSEKSLRIKTKVENGSMEWEVKLPCLLGAARELNKPRFISAMGIIKAKNKPLQVWGRPDLAAEDERLGLTGSPTKAGAIFTPDLKRKGEMLTGSAEEIADAIIEKLRAAGINIPTGGDSCSCSCTCEGGARK
jgi:electron transfer flavoprotein beta subunit